MNERADLLQGTLDLLILKVLMQRPLHGWAIAKQLLIQSGEVLEIGQGSLYPALYRLENRGWVQSEWGTSAEGRRIKLYAITAAGRKQFAGERAQWTLFANAVQQVLASS